MNIVTFKMFAPQIFNVQKENENIKINNTLLLFDVCFMFILFGKISEIIE